MVAAKYNLSKDQLNQYSLQSHERAAAAAAATNAGFFNDEILHLEVRTFDPKTGIANIKNGIMHSLDEGIRYDTSLENIAKVKPIQEGGVITAANASQICDGWGFWCNDCE